MIVKCRKPTCENPVTPEGVCCPLCPGKCSRRNPCLNGWHGIGGGAGGKEVVPPPQVKIGGGRQHPPTFWSRKENHKFSDVFDITCDIGEFRAHIFCPQKTQRLSKKHHEADTLSSAYSQLSPCGHPAITDTPIIRTAAKSPAKINNRRLTEINSRYYRLSLMRTLTRGPHSVRNKWSWL